MLRHLSLPLAAAVVLAASPVGVSAQEFARGYKTPAVAVGISILATAAPTVVGLATAGDGAAGGWLAAYGLFLGPSTGYFYVGDPGRVIWGGMGRVTISVVTFLGVVAACGGDWLWGCENKFAADAVTIVGMGAFAASAVYDLATVGRAAANWNARHATRVSVTPRINPIERSGGLAVRVTF